MGVHDGMVLLHRAGSEPFWTLPGAEARWAKRRNRRVRREMQEELSIEVDVLRLLWLVENFFDYDG